MHEHDRIVYKNPCWAKSRQSVQIFAQQIINMHSLFPFTYFILIAFVGISSPQLCPFIHIRPPVTQPSPPSYGIYIDGHTTPLESHPDVFSQFHAQLPAPCYSTRSSFRTGRSASKRARICSSAALYRMVRRGRVVTACRAPREADAATAFRWRRKSASTRSATGLWCAVFEVERQM